MKRQLLLWAGLIALFFGVCCGTASATQETPFLYVPIRLVEENTAYPVVYRGVARSLVRKGNDVLLREQGKESLLRTLGQEKQAAYVPGMDDVFVVDLDADGIPEYFVRSSQGTRGVYYWLVNPVRDADWGPRFVRERFFYFPTPAGNAAMHQLSFTEHVSSSLQTHDIFTFFWERFRRETTVTGKCFKKELSADEEGHQSHGVLENTTVYGVVASLERELFAAPERMWDVKKTLRVGEKVRLLDASLVSDLLLFQVLLEETGETGWVWAENIEVHCPQE